MLSHRNLDFRFDWYKPFRLHSRASRRDGRSQHIWDIKKKKKTGGDMKKVTQDGSKRETLLFSSGFDWFLLPSLNSCWSCYSALGLLLFLIITLTHFFVWIWMFQTSWVMTVWYFCSCTLFAFQEEPRCSWHNYCSFHFTHTNKWSRERACMLGEKKKMQPCTESKSL